MKTPDLIPVLALPKLVRCRSRMLADEGDVSEASDLLLDLAQFGGDLTRTAPFYERRAGLNTVHESLTSLRDLLVGRSIPSKILQEVDRQLAILDESLPWIRPLEAVDVMLPAFTFFDNMKRGVFVYSAGESISYADYWRYGFSDRLIIGRAFEIGSGEARRYEAISRNRWSGLRKAQADGEIRLRGCRNPLRWEFVQGGEFEAGFAARTYIRLLRTAAQFRATGEVPKLEDPFGGMLRSRVEVSRLKVWSIGMKQFDAGGKGSWDYRKDADIVLEVER